MAAVLPSAAGAAEILLDQVDPFSPDSYPSQDFEPAFNNFDSTTADDFTVPAGETWRIESVLARGKDAGENDATTARVIIYADGGTAPGAVLQTRVAPVTAFPRMEMTLPTPPTLAAGNYWISVEALLDAGNPETPSQWFWAASDEGPFGDSAVFRNPGGGFESGCATFTPRPECNIGNPEPTAATDMSFNLGGTRTVLGPSAECLAAQEALAAAEAKVKKAKKKVQKADGKEAKKKAKKKLKKAKAKVKQAQAAVDAAC